MPASGKAYWAGEVATSASYTYGRFEAVFRSAQGSGLVSALFTYASVPLSQANEIDIENLGRYTDQSQFNVFSYNNVSHPYVLATCFNPHAGFHHYAVEWVPGRITWFVDGVQAYTDNRAYVASEMVQAQRFMLNHWPSNSGPGWAGNIDNAALPAYLFYDWAAYSSYTPGSGNNGTGANFTLQWRDDFNSFDAARWLRSSSTFGGNAGDFTPSNAVVTGGLLVLGVTQAPWAGFNGVMPSLNPTPTGYCGTPAGTPTISPTPSRSPTLSPTPSITPTSTPASLMLIDDFSVDAQYNTSHLNDLGRYTSDDASMPWARVSGGVLTLTYTASSYFYSVLNDGTACLNASSFQGLSFKVRGSLGGETFAINLRDGGPGCVTQTSHYVSSPSYLTLSTSWTTVVIPFSDFGVNAAALASLVFESFSGSGAIYLDDLALVASIPFTATPTTTRSSTASASGTPTNSPSPTFTGSPTPAATRTATPTPSASPAASWSSTPSPSRTASPTGTLTSSATRTASATSTSSLTLSRTATPTHSPTPSPSASSTPSRTISPTSSATTSNTPGPSATYTITPSTTSSSSPTLSRTATATHSPTQSPSASSTPSLTISPSSSATASNTPGPSATYTITPSTTSSPTLSRTATPTHSPTPSSSATPSPTGTLTPSRTISPISSATASNTPGPSATCTTTPSPSSTFSATLSSTSSSTATPSPAPPTGTLTSTLSSTTTPFPAAPVATPPPSGFKLGPCLAVPNPGPRAIRVHLPYGADELRLRVYSAAMQAVLDERVGAQAPGWAEIRLPAKAQGLASGLYYFKVWGARGGEGAASGAGKYFK